MSNSQKVERKLAAIMFTDIAGYTALSAKDSTKSSELLKTQRELLKPIVEKLITIAKKGSLHSRRILISRIKQQSAVRKLFDVLASRYKDRHGGCVRVLKAGQRYGDMADMAIIELVDRDENAKGAGDRKRVEEQESADATDNRE